MKALLTSAAVAALSACVGSDPAASPRDDAGTGGPLEAGPPADVPADAGSDGTVPVADASNAVDAADAADSSVCDPTLVSVWTGNETTQDRLGNNPLAWSNAAHVRYADGRRGKSFDFSSTANVGIASFVRSPASGLGDLTGLTVSLWAMQPSPGSLFALTPAGDVTTALAIVVIGGEDAGETQLAISGNGVLRVLPNATSIAAGWNHFVVAFTTGSDQTTVRIAANGEGIGIVTLPGALPSFANAQIRLGGEDAGSPYRGRVDEVSLYRRSLVEEEAIALFQTVTPPPCP